MEKIIIKLIYFLMRFVKSEISSLSLFDEGLTKIAKGKHRCVRIVKTTDSYGESSIEFSSYIDGKNFENGLTPKESLDKQRKITKKKPTVKEVLD